MTKTCLTQLLIFLVIYSIRYIVPVTVLKATIVCHHIARLLPEQLPWYKWMMFHS